MREPLVHMLNAGSAGKIVHGRGGSDRMREIVWTECCFSGRDDNSGFEVDRNSLFFKASRCSIQRRTVLKRQPFKRLLRLILVRLILVFLVFRPGLVSVWYAAIVKLALVLGVGVNKLNRNLVDRFYLALIKAVGAAKPR